LEDCSFKYDNKTISLSIDLVESYKIIDYNEIIFTEYDVIFITELVEISNMLYRLAASIVIVQNEIELNYRNYLLEIFERIESICIPENIKYYFISSGIQENILETYFTIKFLLHLKYQEDYFSYLSNSNHIQLYHFMVERLSGMRSLFSEYNINIINVYIENNPEEQNKLQNLIYSLH
jgi:hypothetical protein